MPRKIIIIKILLLMLLSACADDNEHFCARYAYLYQELETEPNLPSYGEMKQALLADINNPKKDSDKPRFMLFVLEDHFSEMKPAGEDAQAFCMRMKRWEYYR